MKKIFVLSALFLFIVTFSFSQNQFILRGKLKGISSGKAELTYNIFENNKWSETKIETPIVRGNFLFKNRLVEPIEATLKINNLESRLFIEPLRMNFYLDKKTPTKYILIGSKTHSDFVSFQSITKTNQQTTKIISDSLSIFYKKRNNFSEESLEHKFLSEKIEQYEKQRDSQFKFITNKIIKFSLSHPDSYYPIISSDLFLLFSWRYLGTDTARIIFDNLNNNIKSYSSSILFNTYLKSRENTQIGKIAPDFSTRDINGKLITLSDYKGQYVLLDFWASWCFWCIKGIPHVNELYKKYNDKGLKVIGVTSDRSKEDWIKSVDKNQTNNWIQVMFENDVEKAQKGYIDFEDIENKYPLRDGIPLYILVDKEGKIINKWDGYSEENEKEMDEVIKSIFGF